MTEESEAPTTESTEAEAPERPLSLLATEVYGSDFRQREPAPSEADAEAAPAEESSETKEQPEAEGEEQEESAEADESGEDEAEPIASFEELIEHQEWDPEWAKSLKVPVKVDGEEAEATIDDLVSNYQMNTAAEKRLEEAKSKAKSITEEAAERSKAVEERFATAAKLIENAEKLIDEDSERINWAQLREDDPAEYSAKKTEVAERRERIERMKREAAEEYRSSIQQYQEKTREERQQMLQKEQEALVQAIPEFADEKKAAAEKKQIAEYLMNQGFSEQDVMGASDHRLIVLARKAMLHDSGQQKVDAARKKVAKVPKVVKPGTPKPKEKVNEEKVQKARDRFRKSRNLDDAFELMKTRRTLGG